MGRNVGDEADTRRSPSKGHALVSPNTSATGQHRAVPVDIELKLGWDQANRKSVALKTFRTDPCAFDDHPCSKLVEYEIKSMDRVTSHHNIVRLDDVVVRSPSNVCLVMEAAAASRGNLMETIAAAPEGRLGRNAARFYLGQLLDAVQHCHSNGVCHRDIQPEHLVVDPRSGNMKLSGFGRAALWDVKAGDSTDLEYASSATPIAHAAPEAVEGSKYCGKAADCWSVGATLFTMLAGFSPFKDGEAEVRGDDRSLQPPPPWICPLARSLLNGMMEPDPEKRYTVAEVRSHQWFVLKRGNISSINTSSGSSSRSSSDAETDNGSIPSESSSYVGYYYA